MIASSIWRSKRFRQLETDLGRLSYIYLHTTTHGNSVGAFMMPPEMAAVEMRRDPVEVKRGFQELAHVGLIRHDPDEELVQITNFFRFNSPSSRKQLAGPIKIVRDILPQSHVRDCTACDLAIAMYERALTWDRTVDARGAFMDEAARLIRDFKLHNLIASDEIGAEIDLLIGLSNDLLIELPIQTEGKTEGNHTQTETQTHTEKQTQTQTQTGRAHSSKVPQDAPPSLPANRGRSARSLPDDVQADIDAMRQKARERK